MFRTTQEHFHTWTEKSNTHEVTKCGDLQTRPEHLRTSTKVEVSEIAMEIAKYITRRLQSRLLGFVGVHEVVTVTPGVRYYHVLHSDWLIDTRPYSDWLVVYEAGKISHPIKTPPRDERGLSIGRKLKFTDLIGLAKVDSIGWDRIG